MQSNTFEGYQLIEAPFMCDNVQARKHKKKRINKKWRKRYGMKEIPWNKLVITTRNNIYGHPKVIFGHPEMIARIVEGMKLEGMTR